MTTDNANTTTADEAKAAAAREEPGKGPTVGELAANSPSVTVTTGAMVAGPETTEEVDIPIGDGPANTRIVQAVYPTPEADQDAVVGYAEAKAKADADNAKGYVGWRPGDKE